MRSLSRTSGILRLAREIAPELELHASTQMSITDAEGVRFAQSLGADRVTLARELSLAEDPRDPRRRPVATLEMFVHGALCVAYSGQCFSSEAWGGRSANRGQCAQACRLPYDLMVDGEHEPLAMRAICFRRAISTRCSRFRRLSRPGLPRSRSKAATRMPIMWR